MKMKANVLGITGEKIKQIELPGCFSEKIRKDIIKRAFEVEAAASRKPYGTFPLAGKLASASGKIRHARRKWKTAYGLGISRVPRKIMSRRGARFIWVGAFVPGMRGGRAAHPPKAEKIFTKKMNKKEKIKALKAAIAATSSPEAMLKRYPTAEKKEEKIELPLIVESKIADIKKTKELHKILSKLLGNLSNIAFRKKKIRAGKKRKGYYKKGKGMLIVTSTDKEMPAAKGLMGLGVDVAKVKKLKVSELAPGGIAGRLTLYTEDAIKEMSEIDKLK